MYKQSWLRTNGYQISAIILSGFLVSFLLVMNTILFHQLSIFLVVAGINDLLFLLVGSLVLLLLAKHRIVSVLLFLFCIATALAFAAEGGTQASDIFFALISSATSALSIITLALLLTVFPHNGFHMNWIVGRYFYIIWIVGLGFFAFLTDLLGNRLSGNTLFFSISDGCFLLLLVSIIWHLIASYRAANVTDKQKLRFFISALLLAICPLLFLTILPSIFELPHVPGQWSSLALIFLPLALGYGLLRYQLLVPDRLIGRCITACLCLVFFLIGFIPLEFVIDHTPADFQTTIHFLVFLVLILVCWQLARLVTENWILVELRYFRKSLHRFIGDPSEIDSHDLGNVASLLVSAVTYHFSTLQSCLLVLDEGSGVFRAYPEGKGLSVERLSVLSLVCQALDIAMPGGNEEHQYTVPRSNIEYLAAMPRALLLSEASTMKDGKVTGRRYLISATPRPEEQVLLAPLRTHKGMIGLLILGERQNHMGYAGPDLEKLQMLLDEFTPMVENARLYTRAAQHALLLEHLYEANIQPTDVPQSLEVVASTYTRVAAEACECRSEIWLYENEQLHYTCGSGSGPRIATQNSITFSADEHWLPFFYEGDAAPAILNTLPACFHESPAQAFAWLPLQISSRRIGVLVLTYPQIHPSLKEEQRILSMYATQCAIALDNARMNLELRDAYERQKELDRLKDQFIVTASHELRTPLTAVQGYIELLNDYNTSLTPEMQASFIANARRGCDELVLMVNNIMDASRVSGGDKTVHLSPLLLRPAISHVIEIMDGLVRRDERSIDIFIDSEIMVLADEMRLHQVLLNLLSNALKYSPSGTRVEISALSDEQYVTISIRDHGLGIPLEMQEHLFERFIRLERDMNSPVRGAGLGLFISRQLVEAMGGKLWVESSGQPGEGSIFVFTLPCSQQVSQSAIKQKNQASSLSLQ